MQFIPLYNERAQLVAADAAGDIDYVLLIDELKRAILIKIQRTTVKVIKRLPITYLHPIVKKLRESNPAVTETGTAPIGCWVIANDKLVHCVICLESNIDGNKYRSVCYVTIDQDMHKIYTIDILSGHVLNENMYLGVMKKNASVYSDTMIDEKQRLYLIVKEKNIPRLVGVELIESGRSLTTSENILPLTPLPTDIEEIKMDFSSGLGIIKILG